MRAPRADVLRWARRPFHTYMRCGLLSTTGGAASRTVESRIDPSSLPTAQGGQGSRIGRYDRCRHAFHI